MRQRVTSLRPGADLPEVVASFRARQPETTPDGTPRSWYRIARNAQGEAEIFLYDEIGMWGVTASDFMNDLAAVKAAKINLRINSPGGDVFDGTAIYNAVRRHSAEVTVVVDGLAASAASFIAMAGDTVLMAPKSQLMIHEAFGFAMGPADDMRKMAEMLDKTSDNIASIYADKAGGTTEDFRALMREETWYSDREAVEAGLADGIEGEEAAATNKRVAPVKGQVTEEPEPVEIDYGALMEDLIEEDQDALFAEAAA